MPSPRPLLLLVALALGAPLAQAHPFSETEHSLATEVEASERGLWVVVTLEVPVGRVLQELAPLKQVRDPAERERRLAAYDRGRLTALASSIEVRLDGRVLPVRFAPVDTLANGKAAEGFFVYLVETHVAAQRLGPEGTLEIVHRALPDAEVVHAASFRSRGTFALALDGPTQIRKEACPDPDCRATEGFARDERLRHLTWRIVRR